MVLGAMQLLKVPDKVMTWNTLFCSDRGYYLHFVDITRISWISTFRGYYPHLVYISAFREYYPHFVDIICIGHITSYLARNVRRIFRIYASSVSDWCTGVVNVPQ